MTEDDQRYVKRYVLTLYFSLTVALFIIIAAIARIYINKSMQEVSMQNKEYIDSMINGEFVPRLDTIIEQQDAILDKLNE